MPCIRPCSILFRSDASFTLKTCNICIVIDLKRFCSFDFSTFFYFLEICLQIFVCMFIIVCTCSFMFVYSYLPDQITKVLQSRESGPRPEKRRREEMESEGGSKTARRRNRRRRRSNESADRLREPRRPRHIHQTRRNRRRLRRGGSRENQRTRSRQWRRRKWRRRWRWRRRRKFEEVRSRKA